MNQADPKDLPSPGDLNAMNTEPFLGVLSCLCLGDWAASFPSETEPLGWGCLNLAFLYPAAKIDAL